MAVGGVIDAQLTRLLIGLTFAVGLAIGSFLSVVVWRVPRGESLVRPPSSCPGCGHPVRARDNVPVLSWLLLRGRCRDCGERISWRYPALELATALVFVAVALRFGFDAPGLWALPAYLYLASIAPALSLIDIDTHRLPNAIVIPSYPVGVLLLAVAAVGEGDGWPFVRAIVGAVALFGFYFVLALASPRGMGFGDVKLAGVLGLFLGFLGWPALVVGAGAAFVLGGVYSLVLIALGRAGRRSGIPFGPWMLAGAGIGIFFGSEIATGYLALVGLR